MNIPAWAPGPWKAHQMDNGAFQIEAFEGPGVCQTFGGIGEQEKTNAYLLAAAPDLYNSLQNTQRILQNIPHNPGDLIDYRIIKNEDALAKARGESQ